jgi:energy-coupling factor transport system ATP-binding protein
MDQAAGARITAQAWGYQYPGRAGRALSDVSFTIEPGELVVLMGASGSGKSTLLAALAGTLPEGGGCGELHVVDPAGGSVVPRVGLVQQEPEGNIVMERVGDDVSFPLENAAVPAAQIWSRVAGALGAVGLDVPLDRDTGRLSGGQQQLLAVAAASVADPHLLLLDEPTANLDPAAAEGVLAAVEAVRRVHGCTVVVVEHRVEAWLARADRVLIAEAGSVRALAPGALAAHLRAQPDSAARVWVDHAHLPSRVPLAPPGEVVLTARGVFVADRLPELDLELRSGEVVAVTGPPGAGKSTLLACLAGLLTPSSGTVRVTAGGRRADPWHWASADIAGTFGVVFQNPEHQFVTGRVVDEVHHGLVGAGVEESQATHRAARMLDRLHLTHLADADPFTLSGGEQRRLSVGTALALDPGILLLDEPTFGQDPATWAELVGIIADHRDAGGAVVMATHDPDLVRSLAAREVRLGATGAPSAGSGEPGPDMGGLSTLYGRQPTPLPDVIAPDGPAPASPDGRADAERSRAVGPHALPPATGLRGLDQLALLGAAMLLSAAALVSASVGLNLALALIATLAGLLGGLPPRRVALLAAPALLAAASVAFSNALLSSDGLAAASSWAAAALPASRVLAVALPGLVAAVAIDPTGLADSLVVRLRVPARPAYSVLAGLRLLPLLADEWVVLGRASRARGLGGSGIRARAGQFTSMTFRLLVAALRRGGRLAVALDARGLHPQAPRTVARPVRWAGRDTVALVLAATALVVALATRL